MGRRKKPFWAKDYKKAAYNRAYYQKRKMQEKLTSFGIIAVVGVAAYGWMFPKPDDTHKSPAITGESPGTQEAETAALPKRVGSCVFTKIQSVGTRLEATDGPIKGSGSAVSFVNGGYQVSYSQIPNVDASVAGDKVKVCLVSVPEDCPAGDDRGRFTRPPT
ncbi:hypothetical protein [Acetobacter persici]|nr:hypothetical protein [Acetobacter persici]